MVQELISNLRIAIAGAGPAGCACAKYLLDSGFKDITIFDKGKFLRTLLPTGGGRCNLAFAEFDFKLLAKNYPRGEKFLYSLFSRFSTKDTLNFMENIGVKTYTQNDMRIFPESNSAAEVRIKLLEKIKNCNFVTEKIEKISPLKSGYKIKTEKSDYAFDAVVLAIGGHSGYQMISDMDINLIPPVQSLVGLVTNEDFSQIAGVSLKNVLIKNGKNTCTGDLLFTHRGVSGPVIYKISSILAREKMPYKLKIKMIEDFNLQEEFNKNPHKEIKNLLGKYIPKSLAVFMLNTLHINPETPCHRINGKSRDKIYENLTSFEINITGKVQDGEVVTCGGIDLKELNPSTLEFKKYKNLYCCGEVMDIDGFCGGFNLQNCWTTGYVVSCGILENNSR